MSEIVIPTDKIPQDIRVYGQRVADFAQSVGLPEDLIADPDHTMIKASTPADFADRFANLQPWVAERPFFLEVDWRFLVAARLLLPMSLSPSRNVEWVEIMEAKSPEGTTDHMGVEYTEFFYNNFGKAVDDLKRHRIEFELMYDGHHSWINVPINDQGQEIRISDRMLAETIDSELADQTARAI